MDIQLLRLLVVAPFLYIGIWLVAEESLLGSDRLGKFLLRRRDKLKASSLKIDELIFRLTIISMGLVLLVLIAVNYFKAPFITLISVLLFSALIQRKKLKEEKKSWQKRIDAELPGLIQMLTLMISAGVSPLRSIELLSWRTSSYLSFEMRSVIERVKLGDSSSQALDAFARRVNSLESRRFSNAISMALERGSPLIPVLTALVGDARNEEKNRLLRRVGKSEIALMVPVVFLLLPISVLFALFPSFSRLEVF